MERKELKASLPPGLPYPPAPPTRPGVPPGWGTYPLFVEEDVRGMLREILSRLESIEKRLETIENLLKQLQPR